MLALAPSVNNTNYAAVCLVKISGASTAFPLQDSKTKSPWSGNGNFAFSILIYNDVQAVQNQQYIYFGQTTGTTNVSQTTTTIQWSQFESMAQQPAQTQPAQPAPKPAPQPAAPSPPPPPAPTGPIYIITGSGTAFSATTGGAAVGTAGQPIQTVIEAIRAHAAGKDCQIQFGNGTAVLDIGTATITLNNTGGDWGEITLRGKITGAGAGKYSYVINITANLTVTSIADITCTSADTDPLRNSSTGVLTVAGGTITLNAEAGTALLNSGSGTLNITGGTIVATAGKEYLQGVFNDFGTVNITGGTIQASSGRAVRIPQGKLNMSGGTIQATTGTAFTNTTATVNITGGTVENTATGGYAIRNESSSSVVTVAPSAKITGATMLKP